jgi:asparaginyl-tRNA synthetase
MGISIKTILGLEAGDTEITATGWVRTKRDSKGVCFLEVSDGSCLKNLQVVIDLRRLKITEALSAAVARLATERANRLRVTLVPPPEKEPEDRTPRPDSEILGDCPAESYPLQKKRHSFEFLREIAHLRPRTNTFGAVARVRSAMSYAVHSFFHERGFFYIHTPIITTSDCEGAGEMFQVTTCLWETLPSPRTERSITARTSSAKRPASP